MKKIAVVAILILLFVPIFFSVLSIYNITCDIPLLGYTESLDKPALDYSTFINGEYQPRFTAWFEQNLKPRGILTKTYSTIRYNLFNLGNRPIGIQKDIFEPAYIDSELCINGYPDYIIDENREEMETYVDKLEQLQDKLREYGKELLVIVTPSKAFFHYENIPEKIRRVSNANCINAAECFVNLISQTDIPNIICRDMKDSLEYPAFYTTGIHWSRTFEQTVSSQIISRMSDMTGKKYRNIVLGNVNISDTPFWRDSDVYDLLNLWEKPQGVYYEYNELQEEADNFDKIRVLIHGSSFSRGFIRDVFQVYPFEDIYYINKKSYYIENDGNEIAFREWQDLDIARYLDNTDVLIIESVENELSEYSFGFVDFLLEYLNTYVPRVANNLYPTQLDGNSDAPWSMNALKGVYEKENGFAWAQNQSEIRLDDLGIFSNGLELEIAIPSQVFIAQPGVDHVRVFVNGMLVYTESFAQEWTGTINVPPELLNTLAEDMQEHAICVQIECSSSFIPKELGINEDERNLALRLIYAGRKR